MSWTSALRQAAIGRLPRSWQPVASFHYYLARALLERELPVVCKYLGPGACAVDVGANEGVYTHAFGRTGARVEAFEPQSSCLAVLRAYARAHPNIRVHGTALGAHEGSATLRVPRRDSRLLSGRASLVAEIDDGTKYPVQVRTLDSFAFPRVDVLKVDVEGYELEVLRGARETIARCRPVLLVEIEQRHLRVGIGNAFDQITALGYRGSFVLPAEVKDISEFDVTTYQRADAADIPHGLYVNNFVFMPTERARARHATANGASPTT
jgi:FkbM family methyltransferase